MPGSGQLASLPFLDLATDDNYPKDDQEICFGQVLAQYGAGHDWV